MTKKYLNIRARISLSLRSLVIVRFEVLDKHTFANGKCAASKLRFKRSERLRPGVTRPSFQPDRGAGQEGGGEGGEKHAGRSRKHISLTPQTFSLARGRVFVFFRRPFLSRREKSTLRLVAVPVFSGNIHPIRPHPARLESPISYLRVRPSR